MHVLLLDDAKEPRTRYAEALSEIPGVEVSAHASRNLCVLHEIEQTRPDVVILDVQMQKGGALDLIRDIRAGFNPPVVIALSSISSVDYRCRCHEVGAEFFFDKVRETEALLRAVTEIRNGLAH